MCTPSHPELARAAPSEKDPTCEGHGLTSHGSSPTLLESTHMSSARNTRQRSENTRQSFYRELYSMKCTRHTPLRQTRICQEVEHRHLANTLPRAEHCLSANKIDFTSAGSISYLPRATLGITTTTKCQYIPAHACLPTVADPGFEVTRGGLFEAMMQ